MLHMYIYKRRRPPRFLSRPLSGSTVKQITIRSSARTFPTYRRVRERVRERVGEKATASYAVLISSQSTFKDTSFSVGPCTLTDRPRHSSPRKFRFLLPARYRSGRSRSRSRSPSRRRRTVFPRRPP